MTTPTDIRFLETFPSYLSSLGDDAAALAEFLVSDDPEETRRYITAALSYIFKSLDLIPDGIDDLGFMDDAFVLRVAASLARGPGEHLGDDVLSRLAREASDVRAFLEDDYVRLETYVKGLKKGAARGRTVDDVLGDEGVRDTFVKEVAAWAQSYTTPSFTRDVKTLIKLKAFLNAKLS